MHNFYLKYGRDVKGTHSDETTLVCFYTLLVTFNGFLLSVCLVCAVTRVVNTYGPQTRRGGGLGGGALGEAEEQQRAMVSRDCGNPAIEERLHNIETHLKLPTGEEVKQDVVSAVLWSLHVSLYPNICIPFHF